VAEERRRAARSAGALAAAVGRWVGDGIRTWFLIEVAGAGGVVVVCLIALASNGGRRIEIGASANVDERAARDGVEMFQ
jgi:hypothetical protein